MPESKVSLVKSIKSTCRRAKFLIFLKSLKARLADPILRGKFRNKEEGMRDNRHVCTSTPLGQIMAIITFKFASN